MLTKIQKYLQGDATDEEIREIETWIASDTKNKKTFKEQVRLSNYTNPDTNTVFDTKKAFQKVSTTLLTKQDSIKSSNFNYRWYAVAATLVILIGSTLFWKLSQKNSIESNTIELVQSESEEKENNEIQLTLADGTTKILQGNTNEQIINKRGNVIGQQQKNVLSFNLKTDQTEEKLVYNQIKVPKGKIFTLILSDGSKIWLNAESTLKFPQNFLKSEKTRTVSLVGEAYFEVTKNKKQPFIVSTDLVEVTVLGTKFNVSSYSEDRDSKTTLVEGSVIVTSKAERKQTKLIPGYQVAVSSAVKELSLQKVNANDCIAWIENRLLFDNETFDEITKRIERSYNVIIYNEYKNLDKKRFTGEFDIEDVEGILKTFSISKPFDYTIENNIITIKKKN